MPRTISGAEQVFIQAESPLWRFGYWLLWPLISKADPLLPQAALKVKRTRSKSLGRERASSRNYERTMSKWSRSASNSGRQTLSEFRPNFVDIPND
jgi:hypothetical protein